MFFVVGCHKKKVVNTLKIGNQTITVEVARTPEEITRGLSDRVSMPQNHGMLFILPKTGRQTFWMIHCYFDIDLAYIDESGTIQEIITMKKEPYNTPPSLLRRYPSKSDKIKYALEMNGGWFKRNGVAAGERLDIGKFVDSK